jgi:hypothetical protein
MHNFQIRRRALTMVGALAAAALMPMSACSSDKLLRSRDPDLIAPGDFDSPAGAAALHVGAINRFAQATGILESFWLFGGLLADEFSTSSTFTQNDETDKRDITIQNASVLAQYRQLNRVRTATNQAIAALKQFSPDEAEKIGEMYFLRGYAEGLIAETFCNGTPLSDASGLVPVPGEELTNEEVFERAVATFDTALATVPATGPDAVTGADADEVRWSAQVGKGRALRQLARYAEAATAVTGVPRNFAYRLTFAPTTGDNILWGQINSARRYSIGDSLEGNSQEFFVANAIPFYSAQDPRVLARYTVAAGGDTTKGQDGSTYSRTLVNVYPARDTPLQIVNGIDAELLRAEAALNGSDPGTWIGILNALRGDASIYPPGTPAGTTLPALADPGSQDARVTLHFREKAFWTFGRGQRLGDLRHLARDYSRPADQVFPVGEHYKGGDYAGDVNFPIPQAEENNPNFTACLDRAP